MVSLPRAASFSVASSAVEPVPMRGSTFSEKVLSPPISPSPPPEIRATAMVGLK